MADIVVEKHYYAGNNTSKGFYNFFDYVIKPEHANHIYILKGGPGVGKSSFMKKIANEMVKKGYSLEYVHCSSDHESLDGIIILELKTAFFDGTAPHTIDPIIPGAVDEIINLGSFLNSKNIEKYKAQILQVNRNKSDLYKSAYRYLKCGGLLFDEINSIYDKGIDYTKFVSLAERVISNLFVNHTNIYSDFEINTIFPKEKRRNLFLEAYTASGYVKYTDGFCRNTKVCALSCRSLHVSSKLLELIADESLKRGYHVECYYYPLNPDIIQHLFIPDMNLFIRSSGDTIDFRYDDFINLSEVIREEVFKRNHRETEELWNLVSTCTKKAIEKLAGAKEEHSTLEKYYIESMNFQGVNEYLDRVLAEL